MSSYFFCNDGQTVSGPYPAEHFTDLLQKGIVGPETQVCDGDYQTGQDPRWRPLKEVAELVQPTPSSLPATLPTPPPLAHEQTQVDLQAIKDAGSDKLKPAKEPAPKPEEEDKDEELSRRPKKAALLRLIGNELDKLWETQRSSILSRVAGTKLPEEHAAIRRQWKQSYDLIERNALSYWRRSQQFEKWIEELIWQETDRAHRLRGDDCTARYEDVKEWLIKAKLWDEAGAYAFITDGDYLYAGQTEGTLGIRLTQHLKESPLRFTDATHLRIIIPQYKRWGIKVERLLILAYEPKENKMPGSRGNNQADSCLGFIANEIDELINDAK